MVGRISMFIALTAIMVAGGPAMGQCTLNADGSITCPVLAPQLPAAAAASAAAEWAQDDPAAIADRLTLRERRAMGFTRLNAIRAAMKLARAGQLPSTQGLTGEDLEAAKAEIKEAIAAEILGENVKAWQDTIGDGRDWGAFFQALLDFLEQFMPILLQILNMFGGLSQNAILTPTASLADLVPVVGPPVMSLSA